jgi:hypothetical protein
MPAVCRQFGDEAVRQRAYRILVITLGITGTACNRDGRPLHARTVKLLAFARRHIDTVPDVRIFPRRFIFRPNIAAVHGEPPFGINADEDAGSGDRQTDQ